MEKKLLALFIVFSTLQSLAQISHGGTPKSWNDKTLSSGIPFIQTGAIDLEKLMQEDAVTDQYKDLPYRFGQEFELQCDLFQIGTYFEDTETNRTTWQLGIECPGALAISIRFDVFQVPKGAELFIWSADRQEFLGSFNHKNNNASGVLATGLIHGDKIVVEYSYPTSLANKGKITIGQIVHGYRPFATSRFVQDALDNRGPFGNSGNCEVNVNCPEGADWQIEKRAVAIITEGGFGLCSGALVNNTANDGTPYFLTANHCTSGANTGNWVFYFNHEANNCNGTTGPTSDLISGAQLVANNAGSDFALLLLNDTPPASYNVQYAGWDATDSENAVQSAVCIHHPGGDVKKISREDDAPYHSAAAGAQVWWVDNWELAVTEGGSSGSPLFNQNHRIIGQLYGGTSGCNGSVGNGQYDYFGRFGVSWDTGNSASTRLKDWLDPGNTGQLVIDGYPDSPILANLDAQAGAISNVASVVCSSTIYPSFTLINHGAETLTSCTINYQLNGGSVQSFNWTGSLNSSQNTVVNLPGINVIDGANTLNIYVSNPNGSTDENTNNDGASYPFEATITGTFHVHIAITFDDYPEETSWEIAQGAAILFSGGPYTTESPGSTLEIDLCLPEGCYDFTMFDEYGDGICCMYGNGSYLLQNQTGAIVASGSQFANSDATNICISANNISENNGANFSLYPNPANDQVSIVHSAYQHEVALRDLTGRIIYKSNTPGFNTSISTSSLSDGIYLLEVRTGDQIQVQKLNIRH